MAKNNIQAGTWTTITSLGNGGGNVLFSAVKQQVQLHYHTERLALLNA